MYSTVYSYPIFFAKVLYLGNDGVLYLCVDLGYAAEHLMAARTRQSWRQRRSDCPSPPSATAAEVAPARAPYPSWLVGGPVERRRWDDPEVESFLQRGVPVVLTGSCPFAQRLVGRWSFEYLSKQYSEEGGLSVHFAPRSVRAPCLRSPATLHPCRPHGARTKSQCSAYSCVVLGHTFQPVLWRWPRKRWGD